jgi:hypothetical protein
MTHCNTALPPFSRLGRREIYVDFIGDAITADAGAPLLLLREADGKGSGVRGKRGLNKGSELEGVKTLAAGYHPNSRISRFWCRCGGRNPWSFLGAGAGGRSAQEIGSHASAAELRSTPTTSCHVCSVNRSSQSWLAAGSVRKVSRQSFARSKA